MPAVPFPAMARRAGAETLPEQEQDRHREEEDEYGDASGGQAEASAARASHASPLALLHTRELRVGLGVTIRIGSLRHEAFANAVARSVITPDASQTPDHAGPAPLWPVQERETAAGPCLLQRDARQLGGRDAVWDQPKRAR